MMIDVRLLISSGTIINQNTQQKEFVFKEGENFYVLGAIDLGLIERTPQAEKVWYQKLINSNITYEEVKENTKTRKAVSNVSTKNK